MPTLDLDGADTPGSTAADVSRVYYASALSIVSQMRTNLPMMHDKVFPTSQGNSEGLHQGGVMIGGAISYFWDEALSSTLLSLLEPAGRPPTMQAWLTSDLKGKRHNWFDLDCAPNPSGTVFGPCNFTGPPPPPLPPGKIVYPYNVRRKRHPHTVTDIHVEQYLPSGRCDALCDMCLVCRCSMCMCVVKRKALTYSPSPPPPATRRLLPAPSPLPHRSGATA